MEDIIYEKDYADIRREIQEFNDSETDRAAWHYTMNAKVMQAIGQRFRELPHIIIPQNKKIFEECEQLLDKMAFTHGGRIRSVISYESFDAHIYLDLPFFEFHGEEQETLKYIANNVHAVNFIPTEDGGVRLSVSIDYFEDIGDKDAIIEEEIRKHPDLVALLERRHDEEKERILNDPELHAMVEKLAEDKGMTPEEWVDYFSNLLQEHPEIFTEMLEQHLKNQRERAKDTDAE